MYMTWKAFVMIQIKWRKNGKFFAQNIKKNLQIHKCFTKKLVIRIGFMLKDVALNLFDIVTSILHDK